MTLKYLTDLLPCNQSVRRSPYLITGTVLWRPAFAAIADRRFPSASAEPLVALGHVGPISIDYCLSYA